MPAPTRTDVQNLAARSPWYALTFAVKAGQILVEHARSLEDSDIFDNIADEIGRILQSLEQDAGKKSRSESPEELDRQIAWSRSGLDQIKDSHPNAYRILGLALDAAEAAVRCREGIEPGHEDEELIASSASEPVYEIVTNLRGRQVPSEVLESIWAEYRRISSEV